MGLKLNGRKHPGWSWLGWVLENQAWLLMDYRNIISREYQEKFLSDPNGAYLSRNAGWVIDHGTA
ncbi:MAG: hypothetical protein WD823_06805 [Sulfuricaulis sp.]|uniref:hypothetical protein n=1 Tax=Sulfuricaulis sp. TaxID=2003553 RepID=UPI0034A51C25